MAEKYVYIERFDTKLGIQYSDYASKKLKKDYWVVKKDFIYFIDGSKDNYVYVPSGYLTDGASVPRLFWNIIPPWGKYGQCCVLHDYLCEYNYYKSYSTADQEYKLTRKNVNKIFNQAMIAIEVPTFTRTLIYNGVELYRKVVNNGFEKPNVPKQIIEIYMKAHYQRTGEWL